MPLILGPTTVFIIMLDLLTTYPWLRDDAPKHLIMGDDLDAALSTLLYLKHNPNAVLSGCYTGYDAIYYSQHLHQRDLAQCIYLDLDIYHAQCRSLGHHIVRYGPHDQLPGFALSCNLNEWIGRSISHQFAQKYPFGTIHALLWLYQTELPVHPLAEPLIWLADSTFINGQSHRFRSNMAAWLAQTMPSVVLNAGFEYIDTAAFEDKILETQAYLLQCGFRKGKGQVVSRHRQCTGFQCQPRFQSAEELSGYLLQLLHALAELTGWHWQPHQVDIGALKVIKGQRNTCMLPTVIASGGLDAFLKRERVFSYVFPFKDRINYTRF